MRTSTHRDAFGPPTWPDQYNMPQPKLIVGQGLRSRWLHWLCGWVGHPHSAHYDAFGWHGIQCPRCGLVFLHQSGG